LALSDDRKGRDVRGLPVVFVHDPPDPLVLEGREVGVDFAYDLLEALALVRGESAKCSHAVVSVGRADTLSVEPPMAMVAAAEPIAMLRVMMLILHYPARSLVKLSRFH
jgi:hypothetical protein